MLDLRTRIAKQQKYSRLVEPIELFESLSLRGSDVKELWRTQADALRMWHEHRTESDILFMLNTGAGKTLIGLLAALSLVNETQGKVLYLCATNQLIEQTKGKAVEYGIPVSTYFNQNWSGDAYDRGVGPCLTNYQALLNGKSTFIKEEINAVVFDDAHTAYSIVQDQYTLRINKLQFPTVWTDIITLVKEYFRATNRGQRFNDVVEGVDTVSVLFVPTFLSNELSNKIRSILIENGVKTCTNTLFVWEHLKDKLRYCSFFISYDEIQIVPPLPPVQTQKCFSKGVRRLYLSATMSGSISFCRTFGRLPKVIIEPGGRAGDCERMILPQPRDISDNTAREWALGGLSKEKVLIMVPSGLAAKPWRDFAEVFDTSEGNQRLRKFAQSSDEKIILVGRYDGIDLPGDDCRLLVIDGLPTGINHAERFFEQHLNIKGITNLVVSLRIIQMLGRITRGMTDYGVVVLISGKLNKWLNDPRNRLRLPIHIRKQLEIGDSISFEYSEELTLDVLVKKCLSRSEDWLQIYEDGMAATEVEIQDKEDEATIQDIALAERKFIEDLWDDEPTDALKSLAKITKSIGKLEPSLKAWYLHWLGFCLLLSQEEKEANKYFNDAARIKSELGRPLVELEHKMLDTERTVSLQASIIAERLKEAGYKSLESLNLLQETLVQGTSSNNIEEGIKQLGYWLGLMSSRPDNDYKTGPDVLWITPDNISTFVIECKTNKGCDSSYTKEEMGQYHQHIQWVKDNCPKTNQIRIIVGPTYGCSNSASPPDELFIIALESLQKVAQDLRNVFQMVLDEGIDIFYPARIQDGIEQKCLTTDTIFNSFEKVNINDI